MSWWTRVANVFRSDRLSGEIDEELRSHIEEAVRQGRDASEARRALGPALQLREESRDARLLVWLDSLRADAVFGWRQLMKNKVTSAAAVLSLALGIGACTAAFRLIDALLLRPLPVAEPQQLYALARTGVDPEGRVGTFDGWAYPDFALMRAAAKDRAELIALSYAERADLTYASDEEMERAYVQYVSGWMFSSFGLRPTVGRLLTAEDDRTPRADAVAVLSYDYWKHRFGADPRIVGRAFHLGNDLYEIVGVGPERFTGTEPGTMIDLFLPTMMHPAVTHSDETWMRTMARVNPGVALEPLRAKLDATSRAFERDRSKDWRDMTEKQIDEYLNHPLVFEPAAGGESDMQSDYRTSLGALGVLVALVLLIACANVANLMTAQASARAREMALRVSIGAGRSRLVQLVLVESAALASMAAIGGGLFAWWSAPLVVSMINPPDNPARLVLPTDWRVLSFGVGLTIVVTLLFGLAPALRASAVQPVSALKGGEDPHSRRRLMHGLIGVQTAFCFLVLFIAGLFVATFHKLSDRPVGFSADRVLVLDTVAHHPQSPVYWNQVLDHLRDLPGVESAALASTTLMAGWSWNNSVSVNGAPPNGVLGYFMSVSPGWLQTMKIPLIEGRDFRATDAYPGAALVNQTFAQTYFKGQDPVGKSFDMLFDQGRRDHFEVVGVVGDACYRDVHEPTLPQAYYPVRQLDRQGGSEKAMDQGVFLVRTSARNPLSLASALRREVPRTWPSFRVSNIRTQLEINQSHTVRERLLARLAFFFGIVALLLASVGLYGVLDYSVLQRRREVAIRMALGAQAGHVARRVTADVFAMVIAGAAAGLALGFASVRYIESLLYQVKPGDPRMLMLPALTIVLAAVVAALPPVIRAVRIDPARMLRAE